MLKFNALRDVSIIVEILLSELLPPAVGIPLTVFIPVLIVLHTV
jgi:hypothetical protein